MAQQTAVQFLIEQLKPIINYSSLVLEINHIAEEMFQQQIESAWKRGDGEHDKVADELSKKYYTETYKTK